MDSEPAIPPTNRTIRRAEQATPPHHDSRAARHHDYHDHCDGSSRHHGFSRLFAAHHHHGYPVHEPTIHNDDHNAHPNITSSTPATSTEPLPATTTTLPTSTEPPGTTVACGNTDTYRHCVASGAPVAPARTDVWGQLTGYTPEVLCASDLDDRVCELVTEVLLVAAAEWGNYGPTEYWVMGADEGAAIDLIGVNCDRRDAARQQSRSSCMDRNTADDYGMLSYQAVDAEVVASGQASLDAGRNGMRDWNIHYFTSSLPIGFAGMFNIPFADEQKAVFHEYFHAVQHAHIQSDNFDERDDLLGPTWFVEGGAEFMAQTASQRLRDSGALTASDWNPLAERMTWTMEEVRYWMSSNPGTSASQIQYGPDQGIAYSYGSWAHAWLADRFGPDALLESYYPRVNDLGFEGAFQNAYGMSATELIAEFDQFVLLPIQEQLQILPG